MAFCVVSALLVCGLDRESQSVDRPAVAAKPVDGELHIVSLYEGLSQKGRVLKGDSAAVRVDRPGQDVLLYLEAYDCDHGLTWSVEATPGTHLSTVILGGKASPQVVGLDPDTQVVRAHGNDSRRSLRGYYRIGSLRTRKLFRQLVDRTGRRISSFHGMYRPDEPIRVDQVDDDPQLDAEFPQVEDLDVPNVTFSAAYFPPGTDGVDSAPSLARYSLKNGPQLDSLRYIPQECSFYAWDAYSERWFGLTDSVFALNPRLGRAELLPGQDQIHFSHCRGLTVDSKRNRLLVASDGELYSCSLDDFEWSFVAKLSRGHATHLCYHEADDSLYGTYLGYDGNSHTIPRLVRLNVHGAVISDRRIDGPFFDGMIGGHGNRTQLVSVGRRLVLVSKSANYDSGDGSRYDSIVYVLLINPDDATARLTWKSQSRN
ncbi:MAG: hypothetical protein ACYTGL_12180 [Planctomycetota bacterium]